MSKDVTMHAAVVTKALKSALTRLKKTTGYSTEAALRIAVSSGELCLATADSETFQAVRLPAATQGRGVVGTGVTSLARVLAGPGDTILAFSQGRVEVTCQSATVSLPTTAEPSWYAERLQWPTEHRTKPVAIPLATADYLAASSSKDAYRPVLATVHVDGSIAVATDSYRLHAASLPARGPGALSIPASAWNLAIAAAKAGKADAVTLSAAGHSPRDKTQDGRAIRLETGLTLIQTRAVAGQYPDWRQLFDTQASLTVTLDTDDLLDALQQTKRVDVETITLTLDADKLAISAGDSDVGETRLLVPVTVSSSGDPVTGPRQLAVVNQRYLAALVSGLNQRVELRFGEATKPLALRSRIGRKTVRSLLMPCRQPS